MRTPVAVAVFVLCTQTSSFAATKAAPKITSVDCAAGDTLGAAVASADQEVVIEFSGTCTENITIARDRVTIRGAGDAVLAGAAVTPAQSAITIAAGARSISLSDFSVRGSAKHGIEIVDGASAAVRNLRITGNTSYGLLLTNGARATVVDSAFDANGRDGIGAWYASTIIIWGTNTASRNARAGLALSDGSVLTSDGASFDHVMTASENGSMAMFIQENSTARFTRTTFNATGSGGEGIGVWDHSLLTGRAFNVTESGRARRPDSGAGLYVTDGSRFICYVSCSFTDNRLSGVYVENDSNVTMPGTVERNGFGIFIRRSTATFRSINAPDPVWLGFGSKVDFNGSSNVPNLSCDGTVLTSGVACPAPAASASSATSSAHGPSGRLHERGSRRFEP